jgi:Domain of unknown function (DUF4326)
LSTSKSITVVHCKKEKYDIYIGRPTKWGNPYSHKYGTQARYKVDTVREAIQKYKEWAIKRPEILNHLHELQGKTLACWCVDKPVSDIREEKECHGEILMELVYERFGNPTKKD